MSLRDQIRADQEAALRAHEESRLATLRWLWSRIQSEEIARRASAPAGRDGVSLTDTEIHSVIARQRKQLQEALADFATGGRSDLVEKTKRELMILQEYAPPEMTDEAIKAVIAAVCAELQAATPADAGRVMGLAMKRLAGQADGSRVRSFVAEKLSEKNI